MAIKSILCHMANDPRHRERLEIAIQLTVRFGAHLNVVYNTSPVHIPPGAAGRAASHVFITEQTEIARQKAAAIRVELEERFATSECSHQYNLTEGDHVEILSEHAHRSDLVIVGQGAPKSSDHVALHTPEDVALQAGCPVLILPFDVEFWAPGRTMGKRVLVAWKNSKEAIRAVRESLAFLAEAEEVHVFTDMSQIDHVSGTGIGRYLSLHGIHAEVHGDIDPNGRIGEQIMNRAETFECDLIVMGAYGRSRWREMLFGGVTEYMLHHLDRPVLVSH